MGNVCIIVSDAREEDRSSIKSLSDGDTDTPTSSSQSSTSRERSHGSFNFKKMLVSLSSKKLKQTKHVADFSVLQRSTTNSPIWQRSIMMGERCEPPCFSGLILYDEYGNHVQGFPCKSPRAAGPSAAAHPLTTVM